LVRGTLRIYLGAAPGVGKTYAMLDEGWRRKHRGTDVVVGLVETYGRPSTEAQIRDLEVIPRAKIEYRGQMLPEMDLDAVLERRPAVALVDELAHTNVPGSRHEKRWEDIAELLDAGINVISTLNIQHLASLNDVVEGITGVMQRETVPDAIVRAADQIDLIDMSPEALRRRMAHGNVYGPDKLDAAIANYFRVGNLTALRELALLWVAGKVDQELATYRARHRIDAPWETKERVVVALTGATGGDDMLRRAARMAARENGELIGVHVRVSDGFVRASGGDLDAQRRLLGDLNGRYAEVTGTDIGRALVQFARAENASQLVLGASARSRWAEFVSGSVVTRVVHEAAPIDVHVISPQTPQRGLPPATPRRRLAAVPARRRNLGWGLGTAGMLAVGLALLPLRSSFGLPGALLCLLAGVVVVAAVGGALPALGAAIVAALTGDYLFTPPYGSLRVARVADLVALVVFFAVAAAVSVLVDRLARRGVQVARAGAEAEALARLAGGSVLSGSDALPDLVAQLRRVFDLDGVGILEPDGAGWRLLAKAGGPVAERPEDAAFSAELDQGALLVLSGEALSAEDTRLLHAFVAQLREAQRRSRLESEAASATQLAEANSLRTALLAAVSHDLRTPLASIKAAATSLLTDEVGWEPGEVRDFAETIDEEADRLTSLVGNLLDMSRLQTGALPVSVEPTDVEYLIFSAVAGLRSSGAGLDIHVDETLPLALVDPGLFQQALANVVENAQKWAPPGATVRVEAGSAGGRVTIRVVDQGRGIPEDQRAQVFLPFQRLGDGGSEEPKGVGLGLAVAQGFVEAMGGELAIEDTPGGGATFVFRLDRADP
jgi:two-component system sensor histidine kinase KdpD